MSTRHAPAPFGQLYARSHVDKRCAPHIVDVATRQPLQRPINAHPLHVTPRSRTRSQTALATVIAAATVACGSNPTDTPPSAQSQYYRRDATDLAPSYQIAAGFHAGDLVLRPDHTYSVAYAPISAAAVDGFIGAGTWQQSGATVTLQATGDAGGRPGVSAGDTLRFTNLDGTLGVRFVRAVLTGTALPSGTWVLRSINGRAAADTAGIVASDEPLNGGRVVSRVRYDTLVFSDGVFARDAWAGTTTYTPATGASQVASYVTQTPAVYDATGSRVTIQYLVTDNQTALRSTAYRDTLAVAGDTLVRRLPCIGGTTEQRFVRVR